MWSGLKATVIAAGLAAFTLPASAQDITLRLHQFLPPQAGVPSQILIPWAERVTEASGGKMKVEVFSAMALGGKPPQLIDQARDGVVDIVWTVAGYTPGRFPSVEVFELPFMMTDAEATSRAYWELYESSMQDEFKGLKILATWVHGPGVIHKRGEAITQIGDMDGLKLRGPTRVINNLLGELGATPVGMPVPAIPEALSKGVIDGAVIPWEVTGALKIPELTDSHTEFGGDRAIYTAAFVLAMNQASYDRLPDDMKAVIDANSGIEASALAGKVMEGMDAAMRVKAGESGNDIHTVTGDELAEFQAAAQRVTDAWIEEMNGKGLDGQGLYDTARELIEKHSN